MWESTAPKINHDMSQFPAGVLTGKQVSDVWDHAKQHRYALPAVNVIGSNSINAVMETAKAVNSPVIIQFSNGGAKFNAGKSLSLDDQGLLCLALWPARTTSTPLRKPACL